MKATKSKKLLRFQQVKALVGLSRTQIWRMEQKGNFPRRVQISARAVGWKSGEVQEFIESRKTVSGGGVPQVIPKFDTNPEGETYKAKCNCLGGR